MTKRNNKSDHPDVMVSSTYSDLIEHREAVVEALVRLGFFPVGMEFDSAKAGKDIIASSLEMVRKADAYIGLLSHRYGGVPKDTARNPAELSITELEYREALDRGIPVFMFLMSKDHLVKPQDVESDEAYRTKLQRLKDDARSRSICAEFSSVDELVARVLQSMAELKAQLAQAEGEPAHDQPRSRQAAEIPSLPQLLAIPSFISGHEFVGRRMELAWLDRWATSDEALLIVEAIGGAGKSTLAWQWLTGRSRAIRPDLAGALWYSFYEGGADTAAFAAYALAYITGQPLKEFRARKTAELTATLVAALRARPFLLVLDGLERVLVAYHRLDASQARDDQVDSERRDRACTKLADDDLLRQLVAVGPSKILITSRLMPTALTNRTGQLLPGARHRSLGGLHPDDALALMRSTGVHGDEAAIRRYLRENFDNHPLLVGIVAGLVNEYFREPGNFDRWVDDPQGGAALHLSKLDLSQRRTHILAAALSGLEPGARQLLSRIAALGEAVSFETVAALNPFLPSPPEAPKNDELYNLYLVGLQSRLKQESSVKRRRETAKEIGPLQARIEALEAQRLAYRRAVEEYNASDEVRQALPKLIAGLKDLEQRGLLQWDRKKNSYDLHPVVRGYAFDVLEQTERAEISNRIVDHFQSKPQDLYADARTLADVHQSIRIFRALVQAGRFDEALSFYKGNFSNALLFSVGAPHEVLALIKPFFPDGFGKPAPALTSQDNQEYFLASAGIALRDLNLLADAREALTAGLHICLVAIRKPASVDAHLSGLAEVCFREGRIYSAITMYRLALDLARALEDKERIAKKQIQMMRSYYLTGLFEQAEAAYNAFQQLPTPTSYAMYRPGDAEESLCQLRFYQGILTDAQLDEAETVAQAGSRRTRTDLVRLRGELALQRGDSFLAIAMFERAIEMQLAVGLPIATLEALLARAKAIAGDHEQARAICDRLHELARPPHVELALAYIEIGEPEKALHHALAGYSWAWADGPPYSLWYELEQCRAVLRRLGQPEPALPAFDPNAVEPVSYEDEIRQFIAELKKDHDSE
jgi:tetratricopeptide (TPR) repeat protein